MQGLRAAYLAAAVVWLIPGIAGAADNVPAEMREKLGTCAACHGADGVSPNQEVPSLAAQPDIFTQWQLVYMRDGTRKVEAMEEVVKGMTDSRHPLLWLILRIVAAARSGAPEAGGGRQRGGAQSHEAATLRKLSRRHDGRKR